MAFDQANTNAWLIRVSDALDSRAQWHHKAVVELENRRSEIHFGGSRRLYTQEDDVGSAALQASDCRLRRRIFNEAHRNAKTFGNHARHFYRDITGAETAQLAGCRITDELRKEQAGADRAGLHQVGDSRIVALHTF